jgi:glycosyltransferase involved in cell wall biosynthesis
MKILFLYAEVMGYTISTFKALIDLGSEVHVVYWDNKKITPYIAPDIKNLHMYKYSDLSLTALAELCFKLAPDIIFLSGWVDKNYMQVAKLLRSKNHIVVLGLDGKWYNTIRQNIARILGGTGYFKRYFSHVWVSGPYQFEYARKIGFKKDEIIFDLYSADVDLFENAYFQNKSNKSNHYPHSFLFVGRFEPVKGLDSLLCAWQLLKQYNHNWKLQLIGDGSLKDMLSSFGDIDVMDFMQPEVLVNQIVTSGCFILPSIKEPWGVVLHEFAAAGLPLIASNEVGARSSFLINGLNGFLFHADDPQSLAAQMLKIINLTDGELSLMGDESHNLSHRITSRTSAANLVSILDGNPNLPFYL